MAYTGPPSLVILDINLSGRLVVLFVVRDERTGPKSQTPHCKLDPVHPLARAYPALSTPISAPAVTEAGRKEEGKEQVVAGWMRLNSAAAFDYRGESQELTVPF